MKIGVLAIQGDYEAHKARLEQLGAEVTLVRKPEQLDAIDGIVIPGGESSTFLNFLAERGFLEKLRDFVSTKPTFGTCAGAILLARKVENPPQQSLEAMDIRIRRNAYGRQNESSIREAETKLGDKPLEMVLAAIQCWCAREKSWPQRSTRNYPKIRVFTGSSSRW